LRAGPPPIMTAARERSISVFGLPATVDEMELRRLFAVFGPIVATQVLPEPHGSQRRGFVTFRSPESAQAAMATMKGYHHRGASIHVRLTSYTEGCVEVPDGCVGGIVRTARSRIYDGRVTGYVLSWKGLYGWIESDTRINHPTAAKHEGRVFVDIQDVEGVEELNVGDRVSFFAYVDSEGIGASEVRLQGSRSSHSSSSSSSCAQPGGDVVLNVDGWPPSLDTAALRQTFEQFGIVKSVTVHPPKQQGCRSTGRVVFTSPKSAVAAMEALDGVLYGAKPLQVVSTNPELLECCSVGGAAAAQLVQGTCAPAPEPGRRKDALKMPPACSPDGVAPVKLSESRVMGTVKAWKGRYGWIIPDRRIPQEPNCKHRGWVYADARDLENVSELRVGDRVSFTVYKDNQGIGGAHVRVERDGRAVPVQDAGTEQVPSPTQKPLRWWHELAGDCCPISLTSFEELEYEPFGLLGSTDGDTDLVFEGLWGASAMAALLSMRAVHWFDGKFLACSLVSKGQLVDPVSMRPLVREECVSLDRYLTVNGLPAVNVAEAFDLARAAEEGDEGARQRLTALGSEASSLVRIFDEEPLPRETASAAAEAEAAASSPTASSPQAAGGASRRRRWGQGR